MCTRSSSAASCVFRNSKQLVLAPLHATDIVNEAELFKGIVAFSTAISMDTLHVHGIASVTVALDWTPLGAVSMR